MKRVLIITTAFPPFGGIGALRLAKLAKYLPDFGWEPIVLTIDRLKGFPQTLAVEVDESRVIRTPCFETIAGAMQRKFIATEPSSYQSPSRKQSLKRFTYRLLRFLYRVSPLPLLRTLLPDPLGWYPNAIRAGRQIIRMNKIDVIYSSYAPSAPHFIAAKLQRESDIPWIAEFRDTWTMSPYRTTTCVSRFFEQKLEKRVMKNSSCLVAVSEQDAQQLQELHSKKVTVITNGFDEEDYQKEVPLTSKFTITYTGGIYPGKRDPATLFEAVKELRENGKILPDDFEIRFFGGASLKTLLPLIERCRLEDMVRVYDSVPFKESIKKQKESTILLLLEWDNPAASGTLTGKLYEYLGAGRPILAIAYKSGAIDRLLQETSTGILVNKVETMKSVLCSWLEEWHQLGKVISYWNPDLEAINRYTRREQTGKLAQLLEEVAASGKRANTSTA